MVLFFSFLFLFFFSCIDVFFFFFGRQIVLTPVASLSSQTNFEKRRPKNQWWLSLVPLSELLSQQVSDEEEKKL